MQHNIKYPFVSLDQCILYKSVAMMLLMQLHYMMKFSITVG